MNAPVTTQLTVGALRASVAARLRGAFGEEGRDGTPDLDARLLVAHAVGCEPDDVTLRGDAVVGDGIAEQAMALADRRARGEPVARIVGRKAFHGIDVMLSPATLVPRPDTETVVDAALAVVDARRGRGAGLTIVDLGTGSGAIVLALLAMLPKARGLGTDISPEAVATARANATRLGLSNRAGFAVGDWTAPIAGPVDVVVANPPYIEAGAIAELPVEIRGHDPWRALDGGRDGLESVRAILRGLRRILAADGVAFVEVGAGQREAVASLADQHGLAIRFEHDLAGIARVAVLTAFRSR